MNTVQHIPTWVFFILLGLIALGLRQTRTRQLGRRRLLGVSIALTLFTLVGVVQQWRPTPWLMLALLSWAAANLLVSWALSLGPATEGASYDPVTRRFTVPGSYLPLVLFMTIFACKFVVGMASATAPEHIHSITAAIGISTLYGVFSGLLNARAWRLLKLKSS